MLCVTYSNTQITHICIYIYYMYIQNSNYFCISILFLLDENHLHLTL